MAERVACRAEYVSPEERARRLAAMAQLSARIRQEAARLRAAEALYDDTVAPGQLRI